MKAIEAARKGWLGSVYMVRATIDKPLGREGRDYDAAYSGGMMFDLGSHMIDRVVALLGRPRTSQVGFRHDQNVPDKLADIRCGSSNTTRRWRKSISPRNGRTVTAIAPFRSREPRALRQSGRFSPGCDCISIWPTPRTLQSRAQTIDIENNRSVPYEPDFAMMASIMQAASPTIRWSMI